MRKTDETNTDERRQQIVKAARVCFNRSGLHKASISHICKEAGVSPGHLYYYFDSKEALVRAVFMHGWELADGYFDELSRQPYCLATYLGLNGNAEQREALGDEVVNVSFVMDTIAEISRNPMIAELNKWHRQQFIPRLTKLVTAAQARGELVAGADPADVVYAIDMVATARTVQQAADRHEPAVYEQRVRAMMQHLIRLPERA